MITFTYHNQKFNVLKLIGTEAISQPYQFIISILNDNAINIVGANNHSPLQFGNRTINGLVTQIKQTLISDRGAAQIDFTLEPLLVLAAQSKNVRVILNKTVPETVTEILTQLGYTKKQLRFRLSKDYPLKPYRLQVPQETNLAFIHRLLATAGIWYYLDTEENSIRFCDNNTFSPYIEQKIIYQPLSSLEINEQTIYDMTVHSNEQADAKSNISNLKTGHSIILDNNDYMIQKIEHHVEQNIEQQGQDMPYSNKLLLQPRPKPIAIPEPQPAEFPAVFQAHIESTGQYPMLEQDGAYRLRQRFDLSDMPNASASPPITRLAPFAGWHTPIGQNAEVLVSTLDQDPDQPIILGTVPNAEEKSPVTAVNKTNNKLITKNANQLLMDDTINKPKIQLGTYGQHNLLELNAEQNNHHLDLISKQGPINWQAHKTMEIQSDASTIEQIGADRIQTAQENHQTQTQNKDINHQSGGDQHLHAEQNLRLQAGENLELTSGNNLNINANQDIYITSLDEDINVHVENGNLFIQSNQDINMTGDGTGDIEFTQNGAGFRITKDGTVDLFGKSIDGLAEQEVTLQGSVNYLGIKTQIPNKSHRHYKKNMQ